MYPLMQKPVEIWSVKYSPKHFYEFRFSGDKQLEILSLVKHWTSKSKLILIYGPTGSGKTSLVHTIARTFDMHLFEFNAGTERSVELAHKIVQGSSASTLNQKKKIFLIDEIDSISKEYIFLTTLIRLKHKIKSPMIFICSEGNQNPIKKFKESFDIFYLHPQPHYICKILQKIALNENIRIERSAIDSLIETSGKDFRSIINNLQILGATSHSITSDRILISKTIQQNVFKTMEMLLRVDLNHFCNYRGYFKYLDSIFCCNKDVLFNLLFVNYPKKCRHVMYYGEICKANVIYDMYPEQYASILLHVYNETCRKKQKPEIEWSSRRSNAFNPFSIYNDDGGDCELLKRASFSYIESCMYSYEFIKHTQTTNNEKVLQHLKDLIKTSIPANLPVSTQFSGSIQKIMSRNSIADKKFKSLGFRYKYNDDVTQGGKLVLGLKDLFK